MDGTARRIFQKEALLLRRQALDGNGKLILYPGTGSETYKMVQNLKTNDNYEKIWKCSQDIC
jgi:hypothetical protein